MTPAARSSRRAAIVYNPLKVDKAKLRASVAKAEKAASWSKSLWFETTADEAGGGLAKKAAAEGVEVVLAAGGDGTV
ncbi:diacylglycerol kinase family protein, partial [Pseudolysinimonas sp.]|uniref:diacylglycerol kinase family protein n=1 Tax=Pseudolysinimonas sp. TaxID=2680009 RepID=UPI0037C5D8F2